MGADVGVAWSRDIGGGRILAMERVAAGYRATLVGFRGVGPTEGAALDDLLARMRDYRAASEDLARSLAPGGGLHEQMREIEQLVDQFVRRQS